jgi:hypothetical protein
VEKEKGQEEEKKNKEKEKEKRRWRRRRGESGKVRFIGPQSMNNTWGKTEHNGRMDTCCTVVWYVACTSFKTMELTVRAECGATTLLATPQNPTMTDYEQNSHCTTHH